MTHSEALKLAHFEAKKRVRETSEPYRACFSACFKDIHARQEEKNSEAGEAPKNPVLQSLNPYGEVRLSVAVRGKEYSIEYFADESEADRRSDFLAKYPEDEYSLEAIRDINRHIANL